MRVAMACVVSVLAMSATARAGASEDLGGEMENFANFEAYWSDTTSWETLSDARKTYGSDCDALVAKAKKKLGDNGVVTSWSLGVHPNAVSAGDNKFSVKVSDLPWFCDRYRHHLDELAIVFSLDLATGYQATVDAGSFTDDQKNELRGGGDEVRGEAKDCRALVDALSKSDHDASWQVKGKYSTATLGDMPAKCDVIEKYADMRDAEWKEASVTFEKPFKDAGFTGDRLSWFVYYGPGIEVWYLKGCKGEPTLKKLKKAKLLFQWLENSDGTITIRRFQWKGDKLAKQTDKVYLTEKAAYKGCK